MNRKFQLLEQNTIDGEVWYSVYVTNEVSDWIFYTFIYNIDYKRVRQLKGTWVDMTAKTFVLLKLKWS